MRIETKTVTFEYKVFYVGERIRPTSTSSTLEDGIYIVTEYCEPIYNGDEAVVFVQGHQYGIGTEYLLPADDPFFTSSEMFGEGQS